MDRQNRGSHFANWYLAKFGENWVFGEVWFIFFEFSMLERRGLFFRWDLLQNHVVPRVEGFL